MTSPMFTCGFSLGTVSPNRKVSLVANSRTGKGEMGVVGGVTITGLEVFEKAEVGDGIRSGEMEFANGQVVDAGRAGSKSDAKASGDLDGALRIDNNFGIDNVLFPVAGASGDVAGQRKIGLRGHGDVVGAADAGFEHASAPDGDAFGLA